MATAKPLPYDRPSGQSGAEQGDASAWPLVCPVCGGHLGLQGRALVCPQRHSFDVAREGYANLLSGGKLPATAGDSIDMLRARRAFLDRGHFGPLAQVLAERTNLTAACHPQQRAICDVGCGEGYYLAAVKAALSRSRPEAAMAYVGIDVAKEAARLAARRHRGIWFVVADVWRRLPLADASVTVLLNVLAPRNAVEFARVLVPGGAVIVAIPGATHLAELRERWGLLSVEPDKRSRLVDQMCPPFRQVAEESLRYSMSLGGAEARDLVAMGPSARHLSAATLAAIGASGPTSVSVAFDVLHFER